MSPAVSVPYHHIREYRYLFGAGSPVDGELFSLILPYTNTVCINVFLKELSQAYSNDYIMLIVDNAAWHSFGGLQIPENIQLYPLLPYTPELNPIEMLWDEIREKGFRNEVFASLEKVVDRLYSIAVLLDVLNGSQPTGRMHRRLTESRELYTLNLNQIFSNGALIDLLCRVNPW